MLRYSRLMWAVLILASCATAPSLGKSKDLDINPRVSDPEHGHAALESYRSYRWSSDFSFFIEMRHMPRRGRDTLFDGQMWGTVDERGTLHRYHLSTVGKEGRGNVNLIIKNGIHPYAYSHSDTEDEMEYHKLTNKELFEPLFARLVHTPFDLQMPFIHWNNYVYEGYERTKGRPVYTYIFHPPDSLKEENPDLGVVRLSLDARFNAPVKIEMFDEKKIPTKTFKIISFKKVGEEWIPKSIDLLDERSRDKTRFTVVAAAFNLELPHQLFSPQSLNAVARPIPINKFEFLK
jgi:hypothetical protein